MVRDNLSKECLNSFFLEDLGGNVVSHSDIAHKPLLVDMKNPTRKYKAYIFNCTCPPGGRTLDEYKIQLMFEGQKRGQRGEFDDSDGRKILIIGYARPFSEDDDGVYIIWDLNFHRSFAFSANLQCYLEPMLETLHNDVVICRKKGNGEDIVVSQRKLLLKAIEAREEIDFETLISE